MFLKALIVSNQKAAISTSIDIVIYTIAAFWLKKKKAETVFYAQSEKTHQNALRLLPSKATPTAFQMELEQVL